jgi:hypothetical protein
MPESSSVTASTRPDGESVAATGARLVGRRSIRQAGKHISGCNYRNCFDVAEERDPSAFYPGPTGDLHHLEIGFRSLTIIDDAGPWAVLFMLEYLKINF